MSTTTTTNVDFPPRSYQLRTGAGTLNSVQTPQPQLGQPNGAGVAIGNYGTGTVHIDVQFFDSIGAPASNATPIATVRNDNGYVPATLTASYSNGLWAVCKTHSDLAVTTTP